MKRFLYATAVCACAVTLLFSGMAFAAPTAAESHAGGKVNAKEEAAKPSSSLSGKVVETMNSGGYTYVCIEKAGEKTWVAVPETKVKTGEVLTFQPGMPMSNFTSKSLNRTFKVIYFSGGMISPGGQSSPAAAPTGKKPAPAAVKNVKVGKAAGPDAYTVSEVYAKRAKLHGKNVVIHATVVKVAAGIMGKNWLHLQDGTGDAAKGTNDLVATSDGTAQVGDVVTVKGTVYKDRDFGSGYKYGVILEKASIQH